MRLYLVHVLARLSLLLWISLAFVSEERTFNRSGSAYRHFLAGLQHRYLPTADDAMLGTYRPFTLRASPFWRLARRTQQLALINLHGSSLRHYLVSASS